MRKTCPQHARYLAANSCDHIWVDTLDGPQARYLTRAPQLPRTFTESDDD